MIIHSNDSLITKPLSPYHHDDGFDDFVFVGTRLDKSSELAEEDINPFVFKHLLPYCISLWNHPHMLLPFHSTGVK